MTLLDFTLRIAMSILFGFLIGFERQLTGHPAGIRTNILVSLGSSMFVLFSLLMRAPDPTRIAAQVVTGVGFLCSGIIFKEGMNVRGLNTAATIWCTAAVGVLTSSGMILYALIATLLLIASTVVFRPIAYKINPLVRFDENEHYYKVSITCSEQKEMLIRSIIMNYISSTKLVLTDLESGDVTGNKVEIVAKLICHGKRMDDVVEKLVGKISGEQQVTSVGWELM